MKWNVLSQLFRSFKTNCNKDWDPQMGGGVKCLCDRCLRFLCISPRYIQICLLAVREVHVYSISVPFKVQYFLNLSRKVDMAFMNSEPWKLKEGCWSHCRDDFRGSVPGISLFCVCACYYMGRHCYWLHMELFYFLPFHTMRKVPWSQWLLAEQ